MRSRYTAYVLGKQDYLLQTWHASTRPAELDLHGMPRWSSLQILSSRQQGNDGQVHFRAIHRTGGNWGYLEEVSDFVHEQERWLYVTGETREGPLKPGRNDGCPCGSGRKYKICCR